LISRPSRCSSFCDGGRRIENFPAWWSRKTGRKGACSGPARRRAPGESCRGTATTRRWRSRRSCAPVEIQRGIQEFAALLRKLSPDVEACFSEPGVFWLSGAGLGKIFPSASAWGRAILEATSGFAAGIAVGFSRFATYAVARSAPALKIFRDAESEKKAAHAVPLDRLSLNPELRDAVAKLGIHTLGGYLQLPPGGLLLRFGRDAQRLHELAAGARWDPLHAQHPLPDLQVSSELDEPEHDSSSLLFLIKGLLQKLLKTMVERKLALSSLTLELGFSRAFGKQVERLEPATPTLDERVILRLIHLRIEAAPPRAAVMRISLGAESVQAKASQIALFLNGPRRDLHAASEALAQLRAELGDASVRRASLRDAHLPEAQFAWVPLHDLPRAQPQKSSQPLVRRIQAQPLPVAPTAGNLRDDGWLISGLEHGAVLRFHGPYLASGGWWRPPAPPMSQLPKPEVNLLSFASQSPRLALRNDAPVASLPSQQPVLRLVSKPPDQPLQLAMMKVAAAHAPISATAFGSGPEPGEARQQSHHSERACSGSAPAIGDAPARDYGFADTRRGECLWLFYDRDRRQWFIQGSVE
jgi:protein ImuB